MTTLKMKKVYQVSQKGEKQSPRLFLQHLVCEAAGLMPGDELYVSINERSKEITIQNVPFPSANDVETIHVSSRMNKTSGERRPLVDTAGDKYKSVISVKQKVEICVYEEIGYSKIVIRPLRYKLMETATIPTQSDERLRLLSLCAGAGIGTAVFANTNFFTPVMEIEWEDDSAEVLKRNFPHSFLFNGDLNDCHEVAEADVALVTLGCNEFSSLGFGDEGVFNNVVLAASKILKTAKPKAILFENVPQFYKSHSFSQLKDLLMDQFPYWMEKNIESYDYGSLARRNRTYVIACWEKDLFLNFEFPTPPKNKRRRKLRDYLDGKNVAFEWKDLNTWKQSFNSREAWKDRDLSKTFVTLDAQEIHCIPKRYRSQSASNTYVLNADKTQFRFLTENEIRKILSVPEWFEFCDHTPITRRYEMLGQSVDGRVLGAIGNNLAFAFMKTMSKVKETVQKVKDEIDEFISIDSNGQFSLAL